MALQKTTGSFWRIWWKGHINADKTGLFFKLFPEMTYTFKGDNCHGGERIEERISLLIGANMDGIEKLLLLVIGKSARPRCFKNVRHFPVEYKVNKNAWMTSNIVVEWVVKLDRKENSAPYCWQLYCPWSRHCHQIQCNPIWVFATKFYQSTAAM